MFFLSLLLMNTGGWSLRVWVPRETLGTRKKKLDNHLFVITFLDYDAMLPFICRRCGACCQRTYQIYQHEEPIIADFLGISLDEFKRIYEEAYLSQNEVYQRICPFLKKDNTCNIHPVKPDCCKSFMGENFNKCVGRPEFLQIENKFFKNAKEDYASRYSLNRFMQKENRPLRKVPMKEWPSLWKIFLSANPSPEMIQAFIELNHVPEIIWKNCKATSK